MKINCIVAVKSQCIGERKMFLFRSKKMVGNALVIVLAFTLGCTLTLSLINMDKRCESAEERNAMPEGSHAARDDVFLVTLILSAPKNVAERNVMRNSWLNIREFNEEREGETRSFQYDSRGFLVQDSVSEQSAELESFKSRQTKQKEILSRLKMLHYFAIGTQGLTPAESVAIRKENEVHKDLLLIADLTDTYANLTKKVIRSVEALDNMSSFKYLLKVDDDTYVKLDLLLAELRRYDRSLTKQFYSFQTPRPELYWGYFHGRAQIKSRGQWKESAFNLCDRYIPYALGGGYVISRKLVGLLAVNSHLLSTFNSEDISMGLWLSPFRHIYRKHDVRFDTSYMPRKCKDHHIVLHKRTIADMMKLSSNILCSFKGANDTSTQRPREYFYDWSQVPAKCCDHFVEQ